MLRNATQPPAFQFDEDDPLAAEHQVVADWIEAAFSSRRGDYRYDEVELKELPEGKAIIDARPEQGRRFVVAALVQTRYWDGLAQQVKDQAENESQRVNAHHLPGWTEVWGRRRQAAIVIRTLMRRKLPLTSADLTDILEWCNASEYLSNYHYPLGFIVKAVERLASSEPLDDQLLAAMRKFSAQLRAVHDKKISRLGTVIEQLCATTEGSDTPEEAVVAAQPPASPAPAGDPGVLVQLKKMFDIAEEEAKESATITLGPDQTTMPETSPLTAEHGLLSQFFEEVVGTRSYYHPDLEQFATGRDLLRQEPAAAGRVLLAAAERHTHALSPIAGNTMDPAVWQSRSTACHVFQSLSQLRMSLSRENRFDVLLYLGTAAAGDHIHFESLLEELIGQVELDAQDAPLSEGERYVLTLFRASLISGPVLGNPSPQVTRLTAMIGDGAGFCLEPGEFWTDTINADFTAMSSAERRDWSALTAHLLTATSARPSKKWLKTVSQLVDSIGGDRVQQQLAKWLPLVSQGRSTPRLGGWSGDTRGAADTINEENATCLRGLLWLVPTLPAPDQLIHEVAGVASTAYRKVPGVGPRAVKVGNAAVYTLSQLAAEEAVGQLAMLKVRVRFGTAQKEIEKAFTAAAEALGLPRDQIEEMGVPSYGLEDIGRHEETVGDYRVELLVTGATASLYWFDGKGKALKSVPAKVRKEHKDELKDLRQAQKDIQSMLPAQRDRIDSMFLLEKSWPVEQWRERYLQHPLVGTIASRLLWCVDDTAAVFIDGQPADAEGKPIDLSSTATIRLWHPSERSIDDIVAWRTRLEELEITQPFKQAHRELYVLTDAERSTNTYSNRFAAHIIRQHQFNALCAARGWKNQLHLLVDDAFPPASRSLPQYGLRAEFWVEGIGYDYGNDTNDSGVFLRLATDQVRFYPIDAPTHYAHAGSGQYASAPTDGRSDPIPLDQIPPLVFSEIMRDVDLFVGVASVGNDPTWQDGGPEGRYREYWNSYSFGELSGTAATRREVLQKLVPRLKIADQCSFSDRFLVVRGSQRTYRIHLGSGNILMEPNDQYLCIVPDSRSRTQPNDVFLPFEGDTMLAVILSKAFLLADDASIKDPTIIQQIRRS